MGTCTRCGKSIDPYPAPEHICRDLSKRYDLSRMKFLENKVKELEKERDKWKANYEYLRSVLSELSGNIG